ncbi:4317_t:CDS:2 [Ambispora gerdemannii]|uniref:4317_t:CDS:1 n=1 Tax=Ambispora gerdemannii TaxID=144530 RepID=A0A9N8WMD9_9GLOM|nr:4317_t:CDS:2 [Ambispora gerdemannii]
MKPIVRLFRKFFVDIVPSRETEPAFLRGTKLFFIYVIYIGSLLYLVSLILQMVYDSPYLQISVVTATELPAPYIYFKAPFNFTLTCDLLNIEGKKQTPRSELIKYSSEITEAGTTNYLGTIWGGFSKEYVPLLTFSQKGVYGLSVQIFTDKIFDELNDDLPANFNGIKVYLFDADKDQVDFSMAKEVSAAVRRERIDNANAYILSPKQRSIVTFNRIQNKDLDGHKYRNHAEVVSPFLLSKFKAFSTFELYYDSRLVTVNEQKRDETVLSILSSLGGAFGLGMVVFNCCFGAPQIGPWGWAQELYGVRHALKVRLRSKFPHYVPLVDSAPSIKDFKSSEKGYENPVDIQVKALEHRCAALELLLKDYVIDVGDLESLTKSQKNSK